MVSFVVATSLLNSASCSQISSRTYAFKVMTFSSLSCVSSFTMLCIASNSPIFLSALFRSSTNHCWRIFNCSFIWSISLHDFLISIMDSIRSVGGNILMYSKAFCAFSYASLNLASKAFIFGSSIIFVQICALSSHIFVHFSSSLLILDTKVIVVLSLSAFSFGGVPGVVRDSKSSILVRNPLMKSMIF
jgi:hypothetical protein